MENIVSIYVDGPIDRTKHIAWVIFGELLGHMPVVTNDYDEYLKFKVKVNYTTDSTREGYQIVPHGLLHETEIRPVATKRSQIGEMPVIELDDKPFDVFASSFYLVSRYEEYLDFKPDAHNRFPATESCLYKLGLLDQPLVNIWTLQLAKDIIAQNADFQPIYRKFEYTSTIDVDQAWKYKNKGFWRNLGGLIRDVLNGDKELVKERIEVLRNKRHDPFDTFDYQRNIHIPLDIDVIYFIQIGKRGKFDKNIPLRNPKFQRLIKILNDHHEVGWHPSYRSNNSLKELFNERLDFELVVGHGVGKSRQHFLIHEMPKTYENLIQVGGLEDYTMGYTTHSGFRCGIASSYVHFDLIHNEPRPLRIVPFCYMDITPLHYNQESVEEAQKSMEALMERVHQVGGHFVSLWHNESLSDNGRWKGWKPLYERMIEKANELLTSN